MTSFYSSSLDKYTCFQAHHEDIRQLQPTLGGVVTITEDELKLTSRSGVPSLLLRNEERLSKMNCVLYLEDNALLVGCQTGMITTVDLLRGQVTREVSLLAGEGGCKVVVGNPLCGQVTRELSVLAGDGAVKVVWKPLMWARHKEDGGCRVVWKRAVEKAEFGVDKG